MKNYSEITLKYIKVNKKRTFLTIIGIILSVALFTGIGTILFSYRGAQIEDAKKSVGNYEFKYCKIPGDKVEKLINNAEIFNFGIGQEWDNANIKLEKNNINLEVKSYDKNAFQSIMNKCFQIKKGSFPKNENEIMIDLGTFYKLKDKKIGDTIDVNLQDNINKKYKIVGIYEHNVFVPAKIITLLSFNINENSKFDVFVNLKEKSNKEKIANEILKQINSDNKKYEMDYNDALLRSYLQSPDELRNNFLIRIAVFLISIIVICSTALIYNSFNMSVMERIRHFGILRSIGATPKQIKNIIVKEAMLMCIFGIPIGALAGYFGIYITIKLMGNLRFLASSNFEVGFYPWVFIISGILAAFTIFISAFNPIRKAGKISPMDALKNVVGIESKKIRRKNNKVLKFLFGNEGELAYKNIKRMPKRFWITVFSLVVSLVMFIVFTTFISIESQASSATRMVMPYDAVLSSRNDAGLKTEDVKEIEKIIGVKKVYKITDSQGFPSIYLPSNKLNKDFYKKTGLSGDNQEYETNDGVSISSNSKNQNAQKYKNFTAVNNSNIILYDDNALELAEKYISSGKIDKEMLDNDGVLIVNRNRVNISDKKERKTVYVDYSTYKVGDTIVIPRVKSFSISDIKEDKVDDMMNEVKQSIDNKNFIKLKVVGILNSNPLDRSNYGYPNNGIDFIFSDNMYKKLRGKLNYDEFGILFKNKEARDNLYQYFENKALELDANYTDYYKMVEDDKRFQFEAEVFVYGFISLITLISLVNIVNTININLILRKAEFAMLMAIGMTKEQLTKMVLLEGTLHGIIASILGLIIGGILDFIMLKLFANSEFSSLQFKLPIVQVVCGIIFAILVTLIASAIPLRKLKNMNIVENLNQE